MLHSHQARAFAACQALLAAIPGHVFLPSSSEYHSPSTAIWSQTCILSPECVFEPTNVLAMSTGLKIIKKHETLFAVRSGGHMAVPGAQSVDQGVMISMSHFDERKLSAGNAIASIGPGQLWADVYSWLAQSELAINGGRYPMVGVGGVLLGGGMGYFAGQRGWSVDDIVGWQVVLPDGAIVDVNNSAGDPHADLAWALRGGHNHFGIVTRFDMHTFPMRAAYGGLVMYNTTAREDFFDALDKYMAPGGGADDAKAAINPASMLQRVDGEWVPAYLNIYMYADQNANPHAFENFTSISDYAKFDKATLHDSWIDIPASLAAMAKREDRTLFWAITFKADRRAIDLVTGIFYAGASNELQDVEGLSLTISFQPLTVPFLTASKLKGGNLMGLSPDRDGRHYAGILFPTWKLARDDDLIYEFTRKAAEAMERKLSDLGLFNPYIYINDAAKGQRPFESYAGGANLGRLRDLQERYDPDGFFRDFLQHGFELTPAASDATNGIRHSDL